jgi:uncharacterized membrane protein YfcA
MALLFFIAFGASLIGSLCGIGGGIIIKPLLSALGTIPVDACMFLSGCTVLSMSAFSVFQNIRRGIYPKKETCLFIATGAAAGGLLGKYLFQLILSRISNPSRLGFVQELILFLINLVILVSFFAGTNEMRNTKQSSIRFLGAGFALGILSSFLGIGGGPLNILVLCYFLSMGTREAVNNSLFIIFFSQFTGLLLTAVSGSIPLFETESLLFMVIGGISGAYMGRLVSLKVSEQKNRSIFTGVVIVVSCINLYNMYCFFR